MNGYYYASRYSRRVALVKANELIYIVAVKIIKAPSRLSRGQTSGRTSERTDGRTNDREFIIARRYRISIPLRSTGLTADRNLSGLEMSSRAPAREILPKYRGRRARTTHTHARTHTRPYCRIEFLRISTLDQRVQFVL